MVWPVAGAIVSGFRPWTRPNHQGVDLAAPSGTPVVAASEGRVSFVGKIPGYGNVVALEHEGQMTTVYSHLEDDVAASEGSLVEMGQSIGRVGDTGHLHYEIRREKTAVDPSAYYERPPIAGSVLADPEEVAEPAERVPLERGALGSPAMARLEVEELPSPTPTPRRAPTARPEPTPVPPEPTPTAVPEPTPGPTRIPEPVAEAPPAGGTPGALGGAAAASPPDTDTGGGGDASLVAGLIAANLVYVPAKLVYAGAGAVVGGFAYVLTGGAVTDVWDAALSGDFFVDESHLRGERPIEFGGGQSRSP